MEIMNQIYNSVNENKLRILLLLEHSNQEYLSPDMIAGLDFITIYGKEFGVSRINLHGDNRFKFSELPSRREKVDIAIKSLMLDGMLSYSLINGFKYQINDKGLEFIEKLTSSYAIEYGEIADITCEKYGKMDEAELFKMIQEKSVVPLKNIREES